MSVIPCHQIKRVILKINWCWKIFYNKLRRKKKTFWLCFCWTLNCLFDPILVGVSDFCNVAKVKWKETSKAQNSSVSRKNENNFQLLAPERDFQESLGTEGCRLRPDLHRNQARGDASYLYGCLSMTRRRFRHSLHIPPLKATCCPNCVLSHPSNGLTSRLWGTRLYLRFRHEILMRP